MRARLLVAWLALAAACPALAIAGKALPPWPGGTRVALSAAHDLAPAPAPRFARVRAISGHERKGVVAFTFDDGPHRDTTPRVLRTLADHEVPAAFFLCGYMVAGPKSTHRKNAAVLADLVASGHLLGNHTFGHHHLDGSTTRAAFLQIWSNERELEPYLGQRTRLFRPPYGKLSAPATRLLADLGYTVVRWSIDPRDFPETDAKALRKRVVADIVSSNGGIVLLHDVKAPTMQALPGILADLERTNCRRIARGLDPILPVSLDYFATDATGELLPIPPDVAAQTERTREHLMRVCERD